MANRAVVYLLGFAFFVCSPLKKKAASHPREARLHLGGRKWGVARVLTSALGIAHVPQRWFRWHRRAAQCPRVSPNDTSLLSDANLRLMGNNKNLPNCVTKAKKISRRISVKYWDEEGHSRAGTEPKLQNSSRRPQLLGIIGFG